MTAAVAVLTPEQLREIVREAVREELGRHLADEREVLTAKEAAEVLRMHPAIVARKARKGVLPGHRLPGGEWRFKRAELLEWVAAQKGT